MSRYPTGDTDPKRRYESDQKVRKACEDIKKWYNEKEEDGIAYTRQLAMIFEDIHFHWITLHALKYLHKVEEFLKKDQRKWGANRSINFYYTDKIKYKRRKEKRIIKSPKLLYENSGEIGDHGENIVERSLSRIRNMEFVGKDTKEYYEKEWEKTDEDLDFIYEYNGVGIGIEVKNRLSYIKKPTIRSKRRICNYLGLKPVCIVRFFCWDWKDLLTNHGGFFIGFKDLLVPQHLTKLQDVLGDLEGISYITKDTLSSDDIKRLKDDYLSKLG